VNLYESGKLDKVVELSKGDTPWVRDHERATLCALTRYDSPPTQRRVAHLATTSQAGLRRDLAARRSLTRDTVSLASSHSEFVSPRSVRTHHESHAAVPPFQDAFHND
jgi:hypothetical protein